MFAPTNDSAMPTTTGDELLTSVDENLAGFSSGYQPTRLQYVVRIIYVLIGCIGIVDNAVVIAVIFTYAAMRKNMANLFIINQSLLDTLASFFMIALNGSRIATNFDFDFSGVRGEMLCRVWKTYVPLWSFLLSSSFNLVALSLERYLQIVHPLFHRKHFTRKKAYIVIGVVWILGPLYNFASSVSSSGVINGKCNILNQWPNNATQRAAGVIHIVTWYFIPLAVMLYSYARMVASLHKKSAVAPAAPTNQTTATGAKARSQKNLLKTLIIVTCCFVICWSWNEVFFLVAHLGHKVEYGPFYHFTVVMVFLNSCINPFIYVCQYRDFQRGLRKLLGRQSKGESVSFVTTFTSTTSTNTRKTTYTSSSLHRATLHA